jgi:hypothetical protein
MTEPGDYEVEATSTGLQLTLKRTEKSTTVLIDAITASLDIETTEPVALAARLGESEQHVVLLLPGGKVFEAVGWSNGVRPRGLTYKPLTPMQVKSALCAKNMSCP